MLRFAPVRPCFASQKQDRPSLHSASKRLTLSFALPPTHTLLQRSIKTEMQSGMLIYLLKLFHKVVTNQETKTCLLCPGFYSCHGNVIISVEPQFNVPLYVMSVGEITYPLNCKTLREYEPVGI